PAVTFAFETPDQPTAEQATRQAQKIMQDVKEKNQIAEAEAAEPKQGDTDTSIEAKAEPGRLPSTNSASLKKTTVAPGGVLRASVDEVNVFFAATDHGKSVMDLTGGDVGIHDDQKAPAAILGFRNEAQLPLRLGLIIDTSDSISQRFTFEQK